MTGPFVILTEMQKARIGTLTREGLTAIVIAERLGLRKAQVYAYQVRSGLREPEKRKEEAYGKN